MDKFLISIAIPLVITFFIIDLLPLIIGKRSKRKKALTADAEHDNKGNEQISFDGPFKIAIKKFKKSKIGLISLHIFVFLVLWFFVGSMFLIDPIETTSGNRFLSPGQNGFILGTDQFGRDILSRTVNAGRVTLYIAIMTTLLSMTIGIVVGSLAGYFGGKVDFILSRVIEVIVSIPFLVFAIVIAAVTVFKASESEKITQVILIIGLLRWTGFARVIRGQVMQIRQEEYIVATKALGIKTSRTILKHIVPGVMPYILIRFALSVAFVALTESTLSFLGMGVQPPTATWGNMLTFARNFVNMRDYWWNWVPSAVLLFTTVLSINLVGDTLSNAFEAKRGD